MAPLVGALSALATLGLSACDGSPIEWRGEAQSLMTPVQGDEGSAVSTARLVLRGDGVPALESVPALASSPATADTAACVSSVRVAWGSPSEMYGAWWSRRDGGRAWLVAARSTDAGATWTPPVPIDTVDRGATSCQRPAPAIAADAKSQYVHVTYFLDGPDGPGVFFSHSMDRGGMFHSPVAIMYGGRPAATAVAAADSVVVVAFEDPNRERPQVEVAVSRTWGHIFLRERVEASGESSPAGQPLVALRDSLVAVGWNEPNGVVVVRTATLK